MLIDRLAGLQEVVLLLAMGKKDREAGIVKRNLREWKDGLAALKQGLSVVVRRVDPRRFEAQTKGGSFRKVDPTGGRLPMRKARGKWGMDAKVGCL
jgi:hypothetical protein